MQRFACVVNPLIFLQRRFRRSPLRCNYLISLLFQRGGESYQSPSNFGKRFSKKACMPSFWAGVPNAAWNKRRS
ncbi:hypothetical protein RCH08_000392 [Janthinobacterium sp. CG_S6]|nr:hypothetical protein [Janthinobacterium sp. CG_S6]